MHSGQRLPKVGSSPSRGKPPPRALTVKAGRVGCGEDLRPTLAVARHRIASPAPKASAAPPEPGPVYSGLPNPPEAKESARFPEHPARLQIQSSGLRSAAGIATKQPAEENMSEAAVAIAAHGL